MIRIRHVGIAIFAELHLNQKPKIERDCFVFDTELSFEELQVLYVNSVVHKVYELNIAYRNEQRRLRG